MFQAASAQLDVRWFQVAMDDACSCAASALRQSGAQSGPLVRRNRTLGDAVCGRWSLNQLHDERLHTIRLLETVDVRDMGWLSEARVDDDRAALNPT